MTSETPFEPAGTELLLTLTLNVGLARVKRCYFPDVTNTNIYIYAQKLTRVFNPFNLAVTYHS